MPRRRRDGALDDLIAEVQRRQTPRRRPAARAAPPPATPVAIVIGVDPGATGAVAALDLDGGVVHTARLPVVKVGTRRELDGAAILAMLRDLAATHAVRLVAIEKVHSMPKQGVSSSFTFGYTCGRLRGLIEALGLPLILVSPETWVRAVLHGTGGGKLATIAFAKTRWPSADLVGSDHAGAKDTSGIADALCLAEFARRQLVGGAP